MNGFRRLITQLLDEIHLTSIKAVAACSKAAEQAPRDATQARAYSLRFQQIQVAAQLVLGASRLDHSPMNDTTLEFYWKVLERSWRQAINGEDIDANKLVALKLDVLDLIRSHV